MTILSVLSTDPLQWDNVAIVVTIQAGGQQKADKNNRNISICQPFVVLCLI